MTDVRREVALTLYRLRGESAGRLSVGERIGSPILVLGLRIAANVQFRNSEIGDHRRMHAQRKGREHATWLLNNSMGRGEASPSNKLVSTTILEGIPDLDIPSPQPAALYPRLIPGLIRLVALQRSIALFQGVLTTKQGLQDKHGYGSYVGCGHLLDHWMYAYSKST